MTSGEATFDSMDSAPTTDRTGTPPLVWQVRVWAFVLLATWCFGVALSYALAPFAPVESLQPARLAFLERMANAAPFGRALLFNTAAGNSIFARPDVRAGVFLVTFAISATAFAAVVRLLVRSRDNPDPRVMRTLLWTAAAIATLAVLRYPAFTNDVWMSVAWGRMIVSGVNPYYRDFTADAMRGIPFQSFPLHMTYGPLWAMITAAMAWLARGSVLGAYFIQKALLAGAWLATVLVVKRLAERRSARHAAVAVCLFAWMPASAGYAIGEGHNDVVLALGVALFALGLLERRAILTGLALTASILVKYVSLPLVLLALLQTLRRPAPERRRSALVWLGCLIAAALSFAVFMRGPGFFASVETMRGWHFLTPATIVGYLLRLTGLPVPQWPFDAILLLALLGIAVKAMLAWSRQPDDANVTRAILALLAVVLFGVVGHVWPWFTMWLLPLAALEWEAPLVWPILAFVWSEPLLNLSWFMKPDLRLVEPLGAVAYSVAIAVTLYLLYRRRSAATEPAL